MNEDLIECFALVVWYNGYEDLIKIWRHNMYVCWTEARHFYFTEGYNYEGSDFEQGQIEVLRMWLVILYGEYGTSPRSGWIDNPGGCAHFLDAVINRIKED